MLKIKVVGNKGCSRCNVTKNLLDKHKVPYDYVLFDDLSKHEQGQLLDQAKEVGVNALPIILVSDKIKKTVQEVISCK